MKRTLAILICAAAICAFLLAGGRPVAVVSAQIEPASQATWSEEEAKYTYTVTYLVDDNTPSSVSLPQAALPGGIPATLALTHYDGTTPITMKEVERSAQSYKTEGALQSKVTVVYEGHVTSVWPAELSMSTTSEKIIIDIDVASRKSIGPDGEGTTRLVPETQMTIRQVLAHDDADLSARLYIDIPVLLGSVNEESWTPGATGQDYAEGEWLFVSADVTSGRDDSVSIVYSFTSRIPAPTTNQEEGMGYYRWYFTKEQKEVTGDGTERTKRQIILPEQQSQIYPLAGDDVALDFAELAL